MTQFYPYRRRKGRKLCICMLFCMSVALTNRFFNLLTEHSYNLAVVETMYHRKASTDNAEKDSFHIIPRDNEEHIFNNTLRPRVFETWTAPLPCFPAESTWDRQSVQQTPTQQGFLFVKPYKCASSTVAGVQIRMAQQLAQRQYKFSMCQARFTHGPQPFPAHTLYADRSSTRSFLWTVLREPTARAVSGFFHFRVSKRNDSIANFQRSLLQPDPQAKRDYYLQSLYLNQQFNRNIHDPIQVAQEILQEYNFIGITERLDESLVVLMLLLQLPMSDILYVPAKQSGASYDSNGKYRKCNFLQPSILTPDMQAFLESDDWYNEIKYDLMLYNAANRSLDLTIDQLGRDHVQEQVQRFRQAQQSVRERCHPVLPCDDAGNFRPDADCLWKDSACGMMCLDKVATELDLWGDYYDPTVLAS
ncbi:hypothetical protein FisN_28Hh028 [Fistulifera solaris]|uniref:Uncharacterized protein n=1 Tax=Fistulifera solaris TaxID=1519565 RepID=A0A1Z5KH21_FISSO|nr:hypothetical protein FisN_28Hh028 [Fistulifera solaris]|eukprot:GAX25559.1 hypothetical protein FisN_28Hh028 [Fistulifera solaris]